ncbi:MAG TPA: dTMP kinase [Streptosporangiaceae bacterium]|nr:dTMP kinase [Streptosporangiaceae bacterium]
MNSRSPSRGGRDSVLSIRPFRRLWIATSLSSLGDWLSLVALASLASFLAGPGAAAQYSAVGGVWLSSLLPALVLGPLAGAVADRMDRRLNMIVGDILRAVLYLSIPLDLAIGFANPLTWIYVVQFVASCASLFWTPAKDASVPNLVPPDKLEQANQYSLFTTYGTAPVAGILFSMLSLVSRALGNISHYFTTNPVNLALYFNTATFVVSALTIYALREIPKRQFSARISAPSVAKTIWEGWRFIGQTVVVRGLVIGMVGAFAAGGVVVGLGQPYIKNTLHGGNAGWGVVFAAIFVGLAGGMFLGLGILNGFSRRRLFGLSIASAAIPLALIALIPNLVVVVVLVVLLGACAGVAYVTGYTIVGREVDDDTRGRTFAFLYSAIRVILFAVIAIAPFVAAGFTALVRSVTGTGSLHIGHVSYQGIGYNCVMLLAAVIAVWLGVVSYRHMDDRKGVPLRDDLAAAVRGEAFQPVPGHVNGAAAPAPRRGVFIALEGGEGAGKTTQARLLAIWLRDQGYDVVNTREPGATKVGMRLRAVLLDTAHAGLSARAETLLYAADRAEHVAAVIVPALARGAVVVTDRFVDSSLAYQGAGRNQPPAEVAGLNEWATGGLVPDLTILLDLPPAGGLGRRARSADRLEAEPLDFHERVRAGFLALARAEPERYLVLDASRPAAELSTEIQERIRDILPDPVPPMAEANTGSFPAIGD